VTSTATDSTVAGSVISLPKGGGAISGLGETFTPDVFTGTGNFTVPIALPAGRGGAQPKLSLAFSTGNANGPFGVGWQPGRMSFRPRAEGLFARIEHVTGGSESYWQVRGTDGQVTYYGTPRPAGAGPGWADPATVREPGRDDRVFAWRMTRTVDPFGNQVRYAYLRDRRQEPGHRWDVPLLSRISYADYGDPANPSFLVTVELDYEARPDPFSSTWPTPASSWPT
jgi:hypothetical protein